MYNQRSADSTDLASDQVFDESLVTINRSDSETSASSTLRRSDRVIVRGQMRALGLKSIKAPIVAAAFVKFLQNARRTSSEDQQDAAEHGSDVSRVPTGQKTALARWVKGLLPFLLLLRCDLIG